jgi:hypothetical protein
VGQNFVPDPSAAPEIQIGSISCEIDVLKLSTTILVCTIPPMDSGIISLLPITITSFGTSLDIGLLSYSGSRVWDGHLCRFPFSFNSSEVELSSTSPRNGSIDVLRVYGENLQDSSSATRVFMGTRERPLLYESLVLETTPEFVTFLPSPGVGADHLLSLLVGKLYAPQSENRVSYPPPTLENGSLRLISSDSSTASIVDGASHVVGTLTSGEILQFRGSNFGSGTMKILIGGTFQCFVVEKNDTVVSCRTSPGRR